MQIRTHFLSLYDSLSGELTMRIEVALIFLLFAFRLFQSFIWTGCPDALVRLYYKLCACVLVRKMNVYMCLA